MPDKFNIGDDVKVSFNIKGSKWNKDGKDNYITNLDAWRMEQISTENMPAQRASSSNINTPTADVVDDLPF